MTKANHILRTKKSMQSLGVYKPEFDMLIDVYSGMLEQYDAAFKAHKKDKYSATMPTASYGVNGTAEKANPLVKQLENLRRDILNYSDRLCLNPKTLMAAMDGAFSPPKTNAIAEALKEARGDD